MTRMLKVKRAGPGLLVQDLGRTGYLAYGLSRGGAADVLALHEGAALLGQEPGLAALEMAGSGGLFEAGEDLRIALSGAPMRATLDGVALAWNASHLMPAGALLEIGGALEGSYGYLHVGGGIESEVRLGARSAHLAAGIGQAIEAGTDLTLGADTAGGRVGMALEATPRFDGGCLRLVPSLQTPLFAKEDLARFEATQFTRDTRGNRMGVRLCQEGAGFSSQAGLSVLSEVITPGDVQVTGDGSPFVLLSECQTTGGYPRIGSVLPADLPKIAQARAGARIRFEFVTLEDAVEIEARERARRAGLRQALRPLVRDPHDMGDLLSYQLISGMTAGDDLERDSG